MDKRKIKNYVLLILILLDAVLLGLVLSERVATASAARRMEENAETVLQMNGLSLSNGVDCSAEALPALTVSRDLALEQEMISALIGKLKISDAGGNIYLYTGEKGKASFRGTGDFIIEPASDSVHAATPLAAAEKAMRQLGFSFCEALTKNELADGNGVISFTCALKNAPAFNCVVEFTFSQERLVLISGRKLPDLRTETAGETISGVTALLRFAEECAAEALGCTAIEGLTAGYMLDANAAGEGTLVPVWQIETDCGSYYVSGLSGEIVKNL